MAKQTQGSMLLVGAIAGGAGFVAFVALMVMGEYTVSPALFMAAVVAIAVAVFLFLGFHGDKAEFDRRAPGPSADGKLGNRLREAGTAGVKTGTAGVGAGTLERGTLASPPQGLTQPDHTGNMAGAAPTAARSGKPMPGAAEGAAIEVDQGRTDDTALRDTNETTETGAPETAASDGAPMQGSTGGVDRQTAAEAGGADRTGASERAAGVGAGSTTGSATPTTVGSTETESATSATFAPEPAAATTEGPKWKSTQLEGQTELADRKGSWKYEKPEGGTATSSAPMSGTDADVSETSGAAVKAAAQENGDVTADETVGTEPSNRLSAPREGGADDLKRIRGVGPKLETLCHELGFYHFDQIAAWSDAEVAWVDEHLQGFKGRVRRDDWVTQARSLSEGGEPDTGPRLSDDGA